MGLDRFGFERLSVLWDVIEYTVGLWFGNLYPVFGGWRMGCWLLDHYGFILVLCEICCFCVVISGGLTLVTRLF